MCAEDVLSLIVTVVVSVISSSGLWALIQSRRDKKDARNELLVGLAHDRIVYLGMCYIERGNITRDEYENLHDYLYIPYKKMGGNGSAERVMREVEKLKMVN